MADPADMEVVVVAIPRNDDYAWKISSETIPHMTLLYLGVVDWDADQARHVSDYVEHAASQLRRFYMTVDRRGPLGPKPADVLFFDKGFNYKLIQQFQSNLLQDPTISAAHLAASQFPSWTPHLTLGYPESPAKPDKRDWGFNGVEFDRIALWFGDSEGPTYQLKSYDDSTVEVAMSDIPLGYDLDEVLEHYGVKGMKWGVRRDPEGPGRKQTEPHSEDAQRVGAIKSRVRTQKTTKILSNKELRDALDRMRLEDEFTKLSKGLDKTRTQKGAKFLSKLLVDTSKQNLEQTVKTQASGFVNEAIKGAKK